MKKYVLQADKIVGLLSPIIKPALFITGIPLGLGSSKPWRVCPSTHSRRTAFKSRVNKFRIGHHTVAGVMLLMLSLALMHPGQAVADEDDVGIIRQVVNYPVPNLPVIKQDGTQVSFEREINDGRPVIMSFIFTSCSAICPMLGHTLMKVQSKLVESNQTAHLVSVTIDPENDTPATLADYAKKLSAGTQWDFYTGTREVSIALQKAFNVYRGDKMNHGSVILIRSKPGTPWVRLEGFMNSNTVVSEFQRVDLEPINQMNAQHEK